MAFCLNFWKPRELPFVSEQIKTEKEVNLSQSDLLSRFDDDDLRGAAGNRVEILVPDNLCFVEEANDRIANFK